MADVARLDEGSHSTDDALHSPNVTWQRLQSREARWASLGQRPVIAWLTGLSGAGKTTVAACVDRALTAQGRHTMMLDGDNLRHGLNRDLGFSVAERAENVRRTAEASRLLAEAGLIVLVALISPFRTDRAMAREVAGDVSFLEVFVDAPLATCETRDPKGLYELARAGTIRQFTGVSSPYEAPIAPELTVLTNERSVETSAKPLIAELLRLSERRA